MSIIFDHGKARILIFRNNVLLSQNTPKWTTHKHAKMYFPKIKCYERSEKCHWNIPKHTKTWFPQIPSFMRTSLNTPLWYSLNTPTLAKYTIFWNQIYIQAGYYWLGPKMCPEVVPLTIISFFKKRSNLVMFITRVLYLVHMHYNNYCNSTLGFIILL